MLLQWILFGEPSNLPLEALESRSYLLFSDHPDYELKPSKKNPNVRRWQKVDSDKTGDQESEPTDDEREDQADELSDESNEEGNKEPEQLDDSEPEKTSDSGDGWTAEEFFTAIEGTKHREALKSFANTQIRVVKNPITKYFMRTPVYKFDSDEILFADHHLNPKWYKKYGAESRDQVISHELTHAWDFSRSRAEDGENKSHWASKVAPKIKQAVPEVPDWSHLPDLKRFAYAIDVLEMPAVLTEYAMYKPDAFEAIRRWFSTQNENLDIGKELDEFWGFEVSPKEVNEEKVNEYLTQMSNVKATRKRKWRISYPDVAYSLDDGFGSLPVDVGFIPLDEMFDLTEDF